MKLNDEVPLHIWNFAGKWIDSILTRNSYTLHARHAQHVHIYYVNDNIPHSVIQECARE